MPKIKKKNKIEQCTKIFIYRDLKPIVQGFFPHFSKVQQKATCTVE